VEHHLHLVQQRCRLFRRIGRLAGGVERVAAIDRKALRDSRAPAAWLTCFQNQRAGEMIIHAFAQGISLLLR
jgi:hypothetical protein